MYPVLAFMVSKREKASKFDGLFCQEDQLIWMHVSVFPAGSMLVNT
jgi:hypothetical protein